MSVRLHTPTELVSRYGLLGAMNDELGRAFVDCGLGWNAEGAGIPGELAVYGFFNFPEQARSILAWANPSRPRTSILHLFVDHPFAMDERQVDEFARVPSYRLVLPCADETSLMPMRWPSLKFARVPHAVPRSALCDEGSVGDAGGGVGGVGGREFDLVVAGTIPTEEEIAQRRALVPATGQKLCDEMIEVMVQRPSMGFTQAWDVTMPGSMGGADPWRLMRLMWRYVIDSVNRKRRVAVLSTMQGVRTAVHGPEVWREFCSGTIEYRGEVGYSEVASVMRKGKVCLAWNPTQFVHSWSERVLLSMASGCATVTDDRVLVRRELGDAVETFDAGDEWTARAAVDGLLKDEGRRGALAKRGWASVRDRHLWSHRVPALVGIAAAAAGIGVVGGAAVRAA